MSTAPRPPEPLERKGIQPAALDLLKHYGIPAWRQNAAVTVIPATAATPRRVIKSGAKGHSDIMGVIPPRGRFLALEVKRRGRRPTDDQIDFLIRAGKAGALAFWADDLDIIERVIRAALANPRIRVDLRPDGTQFLTDE